MIQDKRNVLHLHHKRAHPFRNAVVRANLSRACAGGGGQGGQNGTFAGRAVRAAPTRVKTWSTKPSVISRAGTKLPICAAPGRHRPRTLQQTQRAGTRGRTHAPEP
jgi:hypothetical protein